ncbi:hypothetical protein OROGR_024141 [Orobanche gracilis]
MNATHTLTFHLVAPLPPPPFTIILFASAIVSPSAPSKSSSVRVHTTKNPSNTSLSSATAGNKFSNSDQMLLALLQQQKTEDAWLLYTECAHLPNPKCLSRLVSQLSNLDTTEDLARAQSVIQRLRHERQIHRIDANSLGLPRWLQPKAATLFTPRQLSSSCLNQVLSLMSRRGVLWTRSQIPLKCEPDSLTYNAVIKLCARVERKDLLAFVLWRIIQKGIPMCMREGRKDLCKVLRDSGSEEIHSDAEELRNENNVLEKLLPNLIDSNDDPPELPQSVTPDSGIYTMLLKGYMKAGCVADTVRILEAMRHQEDSASHPDHVTYTMVISAFVKYGSIDKAREVLVEMATARVPASLVTYNILLKGYCHQRQIDKAEDLVRADVVSYNTLVDGCILVVDCAGALSSFNEMCRIGIAPTKASYTTLMKAFASSGQPRSAHKVFDEMLKDPRVEADMVTCNMLVEGYCKLGLVDEAKSVIQKMKSNGVYPNVATYTSLANGIVLARKPGEALLLWNEIKERLRSERMRAEILVVLCPLSRL